MIPRRQITLVIFLLSAILILSACRSKDTATPSPTGVSLTAEASVTPAATQTLPSGPVQPTRQSEAHTYPETAEERPSATSEEVAYPGTTDTPQVDVLQTGTPDGEYPLPEVYPTTSSPYLEGEESPTPFPTVDPYPGGADTPTPIASLTATPNLATLATTIVSTPGTRTPTPARTPTPTRVVSTLTPSPTRPATWTPTPIPTLYSGTPGPTPDFTLLATDPETVELISGEVKIVEFFAFWCVPCREMAPVMNQLFNEYQDEMNFIYLDIDDPDTKPLKEELSYRIPLPVEPTFYLLDEDGRILKRWVGRVDIDEFRTWFDQALMP